MLLDDGHRAVQDAVRAYTRDRIAPNAARWDRDTRAATRSARSVSPSRSRLQKPAA